MSSPFLAVAPSEWVASNALAFAIRDRYPVSPGHTLVIPRRLVATWFEATAEEQRALFELVDEVKRRLDAELGPDGYNVGFNAGEAAGQTVFHLHVHVIPRSDWASKRRQNRSSRRSAHKIRVAPLGGRFRFDGASAI